jgi:hypothetical protein
VLSAATAHSDCRFARDRRWDSRRRAFAAVIAQKLLDLRSVVLALIEWNADLAVRTGHRLGDEPGDLPLDIEVTDFTEVEYALVKVRPGLHVAAMDIVSEVIDVREASATDRLALQGSGNPHEINIVDFPRPIAIHEIQVRPADSLDRTRAALDRERKCLRGIVHAERHGIDGRTVRATESCSLTAWLHVQDEINVALLKAQHVLGPMARYGGEPHRLERLTQCLRAYTSFN